jgi:hypothetical protein
VERELVGSVTVAEARAALRTLAARVHAEALAEGDTGEGVHVQELSPETRSVMETLSGEESATLLKAFGVLSA